MLSDEQIREIEDQIYTHSMPTGTIVTKILELLATVKELRKENTAHKELLRKAQGWLSHTEDCESIAHGNCDCGFSDSGVYEQIEEALK